MREEVRRILEKHGYKLVGRHSAVKPCHWFKEKLLNDRACYKSKFYGIESHRCVQMTPSVAWCQHSCLFCWRPVEYTIAPYLDVEEDEPEYIAEHSIEAQKKFVVGYKGLVKEGRISEEKFKEAMEPRHVAISLAGEPTNYSRIAELIEAYKKLGLTTFLVTNGMNPDRIIEVKPTQLYLSLIAYNEDVYRRLNRPRIKDGFKRLLESIEAFSANKSRKVIRITLVKGYNMKAEGFSKLIEKADPDFIEAKAYMHLGFSTKRLSKENSPRFEEVYEFSKKLSEETGYKIKDYSVESKVVLLSKN